MTGYRARPGRYPLRKGTVDFADAEGVAAMVGVLGDAELPDVPGAAEQPFVGVTTDGSPIEGLCAVTDEKAPTTEAVTRARAYLDRLSAGQRAKAVLPVDSPQWRVWINAFLTFPEHGLLLEDLDPTTRNAALAVIEASSGPVGYQRMREAMRLNAELGDFVGSYRDTLTEYCYWLTVFGEPSRTQPWGWQLLGHHIDLHCVFIGDQMVATPAFLGAEFHGERVFAEHRSRALEFMESLTTPQRDRALLYGSMLSGELPHELAGMVDGRHRAGAGRDNLVLPYAGLAGDDLSPGQRELLIALTDPYLAGLPDGPRAHRRAQIERHIDGTYLGWIGETGSEAPFYYRVHSPVVLIEYDNHAGIFLDNDEPEPYHVHTIVRTPNGGDYGKNLLRRHYHAHHQHDHHT